MGVGRARIPLDGRPTGGGATRTDREIIKRRQKTRSKGERGEPRALTDMPFDPVYRFRLTFGSVVTPRT